MRQIYGSIMPGTKYYLFFLFMGIKVESLGHVMQNLNVWGSILAFVPVGPTTILRSTLEN